MEYEKLINTLGMVADLVNSLTIKAEDSHKVIRIIRTLLDAQEYISTEEQKAKESPEGGKQKPSSVPQIQPKSRA